jgi:hypothetical protein
VAQQPPVPDVERLVVDQQPDQLAVGDVHDRLTGFRVAVAGLGMGQRPQLEERVEVRAGNPVGLALVQVPAQAQMPVRQGEERLRAAQQVQVQPALAQAPGFDGIPDLIAHRVTSPCVPSR